MTRPRVRRKEEANIAHRQERARARTAHRAKERAKDLSGAEAPGAKAKVRCQHSTTGHLHQEGLGTSGANRQDLSHGCRQRQLKQRGRQYKEELKHHLHGQERPRR